MPRGKKIDPYLLAEFLGKFNACPVQSPRRGELVAEFAATVGLSKQSVYTRIKKSVSRGYDVRDIASLETTRNGRKADSQVEQEKKDAVIISGIKRQPGEKAGYWIPTENAIHIAEKMKRIPQGKYNWWGMDRLLRKYGLNRKTSQIPKASIKLTAKYPGHVFVLDATPMNQYYMHLPETARTRQKSKNRIQYLHFPQGDSHKEDILRKNAMYKIWVYYIVDMYSGLWLPMAFAPEPIGEKSKVGGENSHDFLTFLRFAFLPKNNLPALAGRNHPLRHSLFQGAPEIIYCDEGSALKSKLILNFFKRLDIRVETHLSGNPRAKGKVESLIGASKKHFEVSLNRHAVSSIEQVNFFYGAWAHHLCHKKGLSDAWQKGNLISPIRSVTQENIQDAMVSHYDRDIDSYGCFQIDNIKYFVNENLVNQKVKVYKTPMSKTPLSAEDTDGRHYQIEQVGPRTTVFGQYKSFKKTEADYLNEEAESHAQKLRRGDGITFSDILPNDIDETNVIRFPSLAEPLKTESPAVPKTFKTIESARLYILNKTALLEILLDEEIPKSTINTIESGFALALEHNGFIPGKLIESFIQILNEAKNNNQLGIANL